MKRVSVDNFEMTDHGMDLASALPHHAISIAQDDEATRHPGSSFYQTVKVSGDFPTAGSNRPRFQHKPAQTSGGFPKASDHFPPRLGEFPPAIGGFAETFRAFPEVSGDFPEASGDFPESFREVSEAFRHFPKRLRAFPKAFGERAEAFGDFPESFREHAESSGETVFPQKTTENAKNHAPGGSRRRQGLCPAHV
jgi:hypothetical protein